MENFIPVRIQKIVEETRNCKSFYLEIPNEHLSSFEFTSGQFVDVLLDKDSPDTKRSYSISTAHIDEGLRITVKNVNEQGVSAIFNKKIKEGDLIYCSLPNGRFVAKPKFQERRNHFFIAAGSGITPIFSMIQFYLEAEPKSSIYLLYGNANKENIIFLHAIENLQKKYAGQFHVKHVFSKEKKPVWKLFPSEKEPFYGRINEKILDKWLGGIEQRSFESHYYVCGPGDLNENMIAHLQSKSIPRKHIHVESFGTESSTKAPKNLYTQLDVKVFQNDFSVEMDQGQTILEALIVNGIDAPHSCTSGACAACIAKLEEGSVEMEVDHALSEDEKSQGFVLTCQARPNTDNVRVNYDV